MHSTASVTKAQEQREDQKRAIANQKLRANSYDLVVNLTDQWSVALIVRF